MCRGARHGGKRKAAARPRSTLLYSVKLLGRLELRLGGLPRVALALDGAEETALVTLVTRRAILLDLNQQRVAVAIERDILHGLRVAAFLAFHPELLPRAAPEMRLPRGDGAFQ